MLEKIGKTGTVMLRAVMTAIAIASLLIGTYILCDMYRTQVSAFSAQEFQKYKPSMEEKQPDFNEMLGINEDTVGWISLSGTNINYPIFAGEDDMEYLNKDAYGNFNISGSIYLSSLNSRDMDERYVLLYGHHQENGSMFGDLEKFEKKEFFLNKGGKRFKQYEGTFINLDKAYNVKVFAVLRTDAYDDNIYQIEQINKNIPGLMEYLKTHSTYYNEFEDSKRKDEEDKILALSTCSDYVTNARVIVFTKLTPYEGEEKKETEDLLSPLSVFRNTGNYWAFTDLIALLICIYMACPLHIILRNLVDRIRKKKKGKDEQEANTDSTDKNNDENKNEDINSRFIKILFRIFSIIIALIAIIAFYIFEDMHMPIEMVDEYSPVFIILCILGWISQYIANRKTK